MTKFFLLLIFLSTTSASLQRIKHLYEKVGNVDYIGENISVIEHSLQASYIAYYEYDNIILARAAFLHDIGHLLILNDEYDDMKLDQFGGNLHHEYSGYQFIKEHFNDELFVEKILILNHANSKRYLATKYSGYFQFLSESSKSTFLYNQGSYMTPEEMIEFEKGCYFSLSILLRRIDDQAKNFQVLNLWDLDLAFNILFSSSWKTSFPNICLAP